MEFVVGLRKRLRGVWNADALVTKAIYGRARSTHLNAISVTAEDSKLKNMPCSFKQTNETYRFTSNLMDIFCVAGTVEQAKQPTYLAEGQIPLKP
eukprot:1140913-Pelagomonas_calceolata.AAC.6